MTVETIEPVEPILSQETLDYINDEKGSTDVNEYIKHSIGDGDGNKETFASFIAKVDQFPRDDLRFKRMSGLHRKAKESSELYSKFYKEAVEPGTELSNLIKQRGEWTKRNKK